VEAIRFAFHEENMIRAAVRAVTLNVYHGEIFAVFGCHYAFPIYFLTQLSYD
jgi:ABC-type methionine transport system ATPase subunit